MSDLLGVLVAMTLMGACAGGWLTHVVTTVMAQEWLLLIAGAAFFPIGMIHGWGIWAGIW